MVYLVTGGAGFIGSHVAERLLQRGDKVLILDNFNSYYAPALKRENIKRLQLFNDHLTVMEGDMRNLPLLKEIFSQYPISHVVHLAAMAGVRASADQTPLYMDVNLNGTVNLFEASRGREVVQYVIASTSSVYGATKNIPFVETDPADRPLAAYSASKRAAELAAYTYYNLLDVNINILRFFNVYGPAGRPDMMPLRLMNAAMEGTTIRLFNNGDVHRDWTYVDDTVDGVLGALSCPMGYEIINLGCGSPISMREFIDLIEFYSGRKISVEATTLPATDPPITYCDNTKARQLFGFDPKINIREGLRLTWEWFYQTVAVK